VDYLIALNQIILMFLLVIVGFVCRKLNIFTDKTNSAISKFLLNVCIPAMIISAMQMPFSEAVVANSGTIILAAVAYYAIAIIIGWFLPYIIRAKKEEFGVIRYMTIFANTMFMGFPILYMMYGQIAVFYSAIFNIPFCLLAFSVGIWLLKKKTGEKIHFSPKLLLNAAFISTLIGLVLFFTSVTIPDPFGGAINMLGDLTVPLSLIVTGSFLASFSIKNIFTNVRIYVASAVRLAVIPLLTWLVCSLFITDPMILGIVVVTSAMPAAVNTVMLAQEHDANPGFASKCVFISTLLSIVSVPIVMTIFG